MSWHRKPIRAHWTRRALALALALALLAPGVPAQQTEPAPYTMRTRSELVLVNVTVRDKSGNAVRGLKQDDFTVLEDNKAQHVVSFDIENTEMVAGEVPQAATVLSTDLGRRGQTPASAPASAAADNLKDRRLILLFFDLSAMQPDEIERAVQAAGNYADKQMSPADLVAVVALGSSLNIVQDFTSDRALLKKALDSLNPSSGQGFEAGSTGSTEGTPDSAQPFTPDDTEYNIFNTDRRLEALRSLARSLARVDQKKSLVYFSSGMDRTGIENQAQLRAAINAAVRANLAIYTLDIRGLQALVPGGEAQQASLRGVAPYSGRATLNQLNSNFSTQETLVTLAGDTGGRAFLDSNDFGQVFRQVQADTAEYYVLGYHSTNPARDGRFRRIAVRVNRPGVKLEYRKGYYAPADFQHSSREDREQQLEEELASDLPTTDLPIYLATAFFRVAENRFFVPVSVAVPGSAIPFTHAGEQDRAVLDLLGVVQDEARRPVSSIRDTVKVAARTGEVQRKHVQYDTHFLLTPGKYHLKFVVRENQSGRLGSFETDLVIPELKSAPVKMSAVVLSGQMQAAGKKKSDNPLVREGSELIPNVTHVFSAGQHLYLYYEVYDPARGPKPSERKEGGAQAGIRVLTNVAFFRGRSKVYETPLVEAQQLSAPDRHAAGFLLDVPLGQFQPGFYTAQVNVIDDTAGRFVFPRVALLVRQ